MTWAGRCSHLILVEGVLSCTWELFIVAHLLSSKSPLARGSNAQLIEHVAHIKAVSFWFEPLSYATEASAYRYGRKKQTPSQDLNSVGRASFPIFNGVIIRLAFKYWSQKSFCLLFHSFISPFYFLFLPKKKDTQHLLHLVCHWKKMWEVEHFFVLFFLHDKLNKYWKLKKKEGDSLCQSCQDVCDERCHACCM